MCSRRFLVVLGLSFLSLFFVHPHSIQAQTATSLANLPLGTVIIIPTTDTVTCTNTDCSTTSDSAKAYRLIKMQPRGGNGATFTDSDNYSYWLMMENYCPWDSANCRDAAGQRNAVGQAFNCNSATDCNRNYSVPQTNNVLKVLSAFYNSLPNAVGGVSKSIAVKNATWESLLVNNSGTKSGCDSAWTTGTPAGGGGFTFNTPSTCNYTGRAGLVSVDEWQGGLNNLAAAPAGSGSGADFCTKFSGQSCANVDFTNTSVGGFATPWLRSFSANDNAGVYKIEGSASTITLTADVRGVLPAIWLSPNLCSNTGTGTFADPYTLTTGTCNATPPPTTTNTDPKINITSPSSGSGCIGTNAFTANITDPDNDTWTVSYKITQTAAIPASEWIAVCTNTQSRTCTSSINPPLASGSYLHVKVTDGKANGYTYYACTNSTSTTNIPPTIGISSPATGAVCTTDITTLSVRWNDPDNDSWKVLYSVTSSATAPTTWSTLCETSYLSQSSPRTCAGNISPAFNSTNKFIHVKVSDGHTEVGTTIECNNGVAGGSTPSPSPAASPSPSPSPSSTSATSSAAPPTPVAGSIATLTTSFIGCLILGLAAYYHKRHQLTDSLPKRSTKKTRSTSSYSDFDPYH